MKACGLTALLQDGRRTFDRRLAKISVDIKEIILTIEIDLSRKID
ncbi:MAG: hypothetical protein WA421_18290 [Nitrososphaeraceae archaeon]|jgi:hypothetical protein